MTEAEWLGCGAPEPMLRYLGASASDRKVRLFSCACCRRAWDLARDPRLHEILSLVEGFADGTVNDRARGRAHGLASQLIYLEGQIGYAQSCLGAELREAARKTVSRLHFSFGCEAAFAIGSTVGAGTPRPEAARAEGEQQTPLVRDIFGNPFRPVIFSLEWCTDTAVALARQMYESRDFGAMPILADALQDAGCDKDDILSHCRGDGPHVRGCWVVDLVLGKQ